jgi:hypothetical protein
MIWVWPRITNTEINLKTMDPIYQKQFKILEAHRQFIEQTLEEWLKLGVVKQSNSLQITYFLHT